MNLEEFKKDIDDLANPNKVVQIKKNILLSFPCDAAGCGHIRNIFPVTYLNAQFGKTGEVVPVISPMFLYQEDLLIRTKTILFQRQFAPEHLPGVRRYKELQARFGYKMVFDIDDYIWGHNELQNGSKEDGVPSYNFGWRGITEEIKSASVEIMNMMDKIVVSSPFLKHYILNVLKVKTEVSFLPNAVPMYFYGNKRKKARKNPILKPKILYTGSPTHYNNQEKLLGDFESTFKDFIIKNVKADKIDFVVMGDFPWMFEEIKDKITIVPWLNSYQYHLGIKSSNADFAIGPLIPNNFNYSKSYIKYQEACAEGIAFIGNTFNNNKQSPYDVCVLKVKNNCKVEDIEKIVFGLSADPIKYHEVVTKQFSWMEETGGFLESQKYVQKLVDNYF